MANPYDEVINPNKDLCNYLFCRFLKESTKQSTSPFQILILDGENMRSTNFLFKKNGIPKHDIVSIEREEIISNIHKQNGIRSFNCEIKDFKQPVNDRYIGLNFDTCGAIATQGVQLIRFLKNLKLVHPQITFSYTFCQRGVKNRKYFTENNDLDNLTTTHGNKGPVVFKDENKKFFNKIKYLFSLKGYSMHEEQNHTYSGTGNNDNKKSSNMYFHVCNFRKTEHLMRKRTCKSTFTNSVDIVVQPSKKKKIESKSTDKVDGRRYCNHCFNSNRDYNHRQRDCPNNSKNTSTPKQKSPSKGTYPDMVRDINDVLKKYELTPVKGRTLKEKIEYIKKLIKEQLGSQYKLTKIVDC